MRSGLGVCCLAMSTYRVYIISKFLEPLIYDYNANISDLTSNVPLKEISKHKSYDLQFNVTIPKIWMIRNMVPSGCFCIFIVFVFVVERDDNQLTLEK